ncbi:MAG: hypothetical protein AB1512_08090 [Thermodesulfobacteriota bacterium]
MSWFETLTKDGFQLAVREAIKPELDKLGQKMASIENRVSRMEGQTEGISNRLDGYDARLGRVSDRMDRLIESQNQLILKIGEWLNEQRLDIIDLKHRVEALERKVA